MVVLPLPQDLAWRSYERSLRLRKRSEATIRTYAFTYGQLSTWAGQPAIHLGRLDIEEWLTHRMGMVSAGRVKQDMINLKIFYRWAVAEEIITVNPMSRIPVPDSATEPRRVLTQDQLRAVIEACRGRTFIDRRDTAVIRILCEVGSPRLGELIAMTTTGSIDWGSDLLSLCGKTGARRIPIGNKTARALELYLRARDGHRCAGLPNLWLGKMGGLKRGGFQEMVKRRAAQAGIEGSAFPHLWRHATAAIAQEMGMSDSMMESLYGWADGSRMTRVYGAGTRAVRAQQAARTLGLGDKI